MLFFSFRTANQWPSIKGETPFGQLPVLYDGNRIYAQSGAIYRILARRGGLDGGSDHEFALNSQLIEEYQDIFGSLTKPLYVKDDAARAAAWTETEKYVHTHFGFLEKLIGDNGQFSPNRLLVGDVVVVCLINVTLVAIPDALKDFPKLAAFYQKNHAQVLGDLDKFNPYVVRK